MKLDVRVEERSRKGVLANLVAREEDLLEAALGVVERYRLTALAYAMSIVPVDTGRMRRSLRALYVGAGRRVWVLFYDPEVFAAEGVVYYPVFVEYGTKRMRARPTLRRTMRKIDRPYRRDLKRAMRWAGS